MFIVYKANALDIPFDLNKAGKAKHVIQLASHSR